MKFNMQGRLSKCLLLAYRTPADSVRNLLPRGLELVTHGPWAFWNVVICEVERMRPMGVPRCAGVSYRHAAYRLYVKAATAREGRMRGLYFVRSHADHALITRGGNLTSDFNFHRARITLDVCEQKIEANTAATASGDADAHAHLIATKGEPALAADSCFDSFDEARAMLKYQPLGLSVSGNQRWLKLAEVFRDEAAWRETHLRVHAARFGLFENLNQHDLHLEMATQVAPIDYRWRLGRRVELVPQSTENVGETKHRIISPTGLH